MKREEGGGQVGQAGRCQQKARVALSLRWEVLRGLAGEAKICLFGRST